MPLIVEDGTGLANADSLISIEFANTYHASRGNVAWVDILPAQKEIVLRRATDYITYIFGRSFVSSKLVSGQSLPFPRLAWSGVPLGVKEAVAELALIANSTPLMPTSKTIRKRSIKVGPIAVEYDMQSGSGLSFANAVSRLGEFLGASSSGMTTRLVRT